MGRVFFTVAKAAPCDPEFVARAADGQLGAFTPALYSPSLKAEEALRETGYDRVFVVSAYEDGLQMKFNRKILGPVEGCPKDGTTVCLRDGLAVPEASITAVHGAYETSDELLRVFRRREASTLLADGRDGVTRMFVGAADAVPWAVMVRIFDLVAVSDEEVRRGGGAPLMTIWSVAD